jgi:hypothetical protein
VWKYHLAFALLVALVIVSPGYVRGLAQPTRVGIDGMGYAITTQYLLNGGSLEALKQEVKEETGTDDLSTALATNARSLAVSSNVASEFFLKSFRWYPSWVAAILMALGEKCALRVQLVGLSLSLIILFSVSHYYLRTLVQLPEWVALLGAAALLMNANILNVVCEGQHAQIFSAPFFFLLLSQLYVLRSRYGANPFGESIVWRQEYIFTTVLAAIVICSYPELIFLTGLLAVVVAGLDLVLLWGRVNRGLIGFGIACLLGCLLVGAYSIRIPLFLYHHIQHLQTGGGFWQPQWATPAEILGIFDIYQIPVPDYLGREYFYAFAVLSLSLLCVEIACVGVLAGRRLDLSFWFAPLAFVLAEFVKDCYVDDTLNYKYMKAYTLLMLPIVTFFFGAFRVLVRSVAWSRLALLGCLLWIPWVGVGYLNRYVDEADYVPCSPGRVERLQASVDWNNYVWAIRSRGIPTFAYASLVRVNWIDLGWDFPKLSPHYGKRIGIWYDRAKDPNEPTPLPPLPVLYEDEDIILLDSGITLESDTLMPAALESVFQGEELKTQYLMACHTFLERFGVR